MATLTGNPIKDSYDGLIKTTDNAAIGAVEKEITDGLGNVSNLKIGTTSSSFTGTLDLTGATVTGLPDVDTTYSIDSVQDGANADIKLVDQLGNSTKVTLVAGDNVTLTNSGNDLTIDAPDTNTTYTVGSVQDGLNADIKLTDQLGNQSKVTLVAGTNITLTNTGSDLTIDAAGGGGAAGLVSGTGTDSMMSSSTLTTNAAQANGNVGVALGDGAKANGPESIAIGNFAEATQTGCAAVGQYSEASATYASAWGRTAYARAEGSVAFGQQAGVLATEPGAVAMGRQVVAVNSDTTHVRALYIVAPNGGIGGNGITMLSPDGTAYTLTVSNAGALVIS